MTARRTLNFQAANSRNGLSYMMRYANLRQVSKSYRGIGRTITPLNRARLLHSIQSDPRPVRRGVVLRHFSSSHWDHADNVQSQKFTTDVSKSTIFALSTAAGRAAIAVVRVSGPACIEVNQTCDLGSAHDENVDKFRFITRSVLERSSQTREKRSFAHSTNRIDVLPMKRCWTRKRWFYIFLLREP